MSLPNFTVGVGFQLDQRSFDQSTGALNSLGSKAKQVAALLIGALGVKTLTLDATKSIMALDQIATKLGLSTERVNALGAAYKALGGDETAAIQDLVRAEELRTTSYDDLAGLFASAGVRGIDVGSILNTKNAEDALLRIHELLGQVTDSRQKAQLIQFMGLSDAGTQIGLKFTKDDEFKKLVQEFEANDIVPEGIEDAAVRFNTELVRTEQALKGVSLTLSSALIPAFSSMLESFNNIIADNKETIDASIQWIADNIEGVLLAIGGLTAALIGAGIVAKIAAIGKAFATFFGMFGKKPDLPTASPNGSCCCKCDGTKPSNDAELPEGKDDKSKSKRKGKRETDSVDTPDTDKKEEVKDKKGKKGRKGRKKKGKPLVNLDDVQPELGKTNRPKVRGKKAKIPKINATKAVGSVVSEAVEKVGVKGLGTAAKALGTAVKFGARAIPVAGTVITAGMIAYEMLNGATLGEAVFGDNVLGQTTDKLVTGLTDSIKGAFTALTAPSKEEVALDTVTKGADAAINHMDTQALANTISLNINNANQELMTKLTDTLNKLSSAQSKQQPIYVNAVLELDGEVLAQKTIETLNEQIETASTDLVTSIMG